jgi:hypothetical protein
MRESEGGRQAANVLVLSAIPQGFCIPSIAHPSIAHPSIAQSYLSHSLHSAYALRFNRGKGCASVLNTILWSGSTSSGPNNK